jgi:phage baseplate assembly protein V
MNQWISKIWTAVQMAIGRGRVTHVDDSGNVQLLQVRLGGDELRDHTRRLAEYGFTSSPPEGADVVALFVAGDRSKGVVIATGHQASRLRGLQAGEVAIFDDQGQSVYLTRSGIIVNGAGNPLVVNNTPVVTVNASTKVALNTPELDVSGGIKAGGDITDNTATNAKSMAQMRTIFNGHHHNVVNVQAGSSTVTSNVPNEQE